MSQRSPVIVVMLVAVLLGYLAGGRLRRFEALRVNWWGLVVAGIALQVLPVPSPGDTDPQTIGAAMLVASYTLLLVFLMVNRWIPAAKLMGLGLILNLAVVAPNGGMPVSVWAIQKASGQQSGQPPTAESSPKHHLMTDTDILRPLGDVIPVPPPAGVVLSPGDVLLYLGAAWFVIQVMRGRSRGNPRPLAVWILAYRGKHAPDHWRMPARYRASIRAEAGQSGT